MNSKIILNDEALSRSFIPETLPYRDKERLLLLSNIRNSVNTFLCGRCGSGKTALIKGVIRNINGKDVFVAYIDCSLYQTTYSVLKEVIPASEFVLYRSNYELIKQLQKVVKNRRFVVCLDDFMHLKDKDLVARFMSMGVCVVLVSDSLEDLASLGQNVRSNIACTIKLPDYSTEQTFDILGDRAERALAKGSINDSAIKKIAECVKGDIAWGINALKAVALKAESRGKRAIEEDDIELEEDRHPKLSQDEQILLKILNEWKSLPSSKLFDLYIRSADHPKGERAFRNYMESLCSKGLARAVGEKRGRIYECVGDSNAEDTA